MQKTLYFIAGCNGAGKTTASMKILPDILEDVIRRRYKAGLKNLFERYMPIMDSWQLLSNADSGTKVIAYNVRSEIIIEEKELFEKIKNYARNN